MKYKIKFRVNSTAGKKTKYSINIEEGAAFTMQAGPLGLDAAIAPASTVICLLKVRDAQLFAQPSEPSEPFRHNNRLSGECKLRPGDFLEKSGFMVEFLEVPVSESEDEGATRFVDISDQKAVLHAASSAPEVSEPVPAAAAAPAPEPAVPAKMGKRELRKQRKKKRQQEFLKRQTQADAPSELSAEGPELPEAEFKEGWGEESQESPALQATPAVSEEEPPAPQQAPMILEKAAPLPSMSVPKAVYVLDPSAPSPVQKRRSLVAGGVFAAAGVLVFVLFFQPSIPPSPEKGSRSIAEAPATAAPTGVTETAEAPIKNGMNVVAPSSVSAHIAEAALPVSADRHMQDDFFAAIKTGDIRRVREMVESRDVNPDFTLEKGSTALMVASSHGQIKVVQYLVSLKVSLDARDPEGTTALMWAVHRGHAEVVRFLLSKGADPHLQRDDGDRAIDIAHRWNQVEIVKLLRKAEGRDLAGHR